MQDFVKTMSFQGFKATVSTLHPIYQQNSLAVKSFRFSSLRNRKKSKNRPFQYLINYIKLIN